ncbi:MAG: exodeoxyribonuclease VII large subunit, partial [Gammaproteobacteria bacterium]
MQPPTVSLPQRDVYSVGRLNREVRAALEAGFALLWVEGELSNVARPASGHLYLTLKDAQAQVRCAMFRNRCQFLGFTPQNGMQVLVRARVSLYEPRGDFQLIIEHMEEAGDGALLRAFEALKQRLSKEGLFEEARKRPIPTLPRRVGVVTSPIGAAIRDILSVLRRRFPALPVLIYPVPVQGTDAAPQIAAAVRRASERADCDVLIVTRGGGSLEDLWAFNEELVARAIHDSAIPVVSGVGHEIDFTIADFVADRRAPTPSAAAELVSPDQAEWLAQLRALDARLLQRLQRHLQELA